MVEEQSYFSTSNVSTINESQLEALDSVVPKKNNKIFVVEGDSRDYLYFDTIQNVTKRNESLNNSIQIVSASLLFNHIVEEAKKKQKIEPYIIITYCNFINNSSVICGVITDYLLNKNPNEQKIVLNALKWVPGNNLHHLLDKTLTEIYDQGSKKIKSIITSIRSYWKWLDTF